MKGRNYMKGLGVDGKEFWGVRILKLALKKYGVFAIDPTF
jgi:hypothetical protein